MKVITLLTDFGLSDGYPGIMKGVILGISPDVQIVDISHSISHQNIHEAALVLSRSYRYFPSGSIHVAVIDPGVGTSRRPIAAQVGEHIFVGPDNGLFSHVIQKAGEESLPVTVYHLNNLQFWLPKVSNVFHGRDVFAPVAAHLANGVAMSQVGQQITDPVLFPLKILEKIANGWKGEIISIDHFGNLTTNIPRSCIPNDARVEIAGRVIHSLSQAYGDRKPGELVAVIDSSDSLSICIVNGSAANELGATVGDAVLTYTAK